MTVFSSNALCHPSGHEDKTNPCARVKTDTRDACETLREEPFVQCHARVDVEKYYKLCMDDSCHRSNEDPWCMILAAYARECTKAGVDKLNWRHQEFCRKL